VSRPDPRTGELTPVAVVVIGRFDDPRARDCQPGRRHCGEEFVLERIAWADGQWIDRPIVRDPAVPAEEQAMSGQIRRLLTSRESDRGEVFLYEALLTVDLLLKVDPTAAAAIGGVPPAPVWYVRSVGRAVADVDERRSGGSRGRSRARNGLVLATGDRADSSPSHRHRSAACAPSSVDATLRWTSANSTIWLPATSG
jgi:hypothetical protein